jgi:hypothetical protein
MAFSSCVGPPSAPPIGGGGAGDRAGALLVLVLVVAALSLRISGVRVHPRLCVRNELSERDFFRTVVDSRVGWWVMLCVLGVACRSKKLAFNIPPRTQTGGRAARCPTTPFGICSCWRPASCSTSLCAYHYYDHYYHNYFLFFTLSS